MGIVSKVGVVNFAGIAVAFRKQMSLGIFESSDFIWVRSEKTADFKTRAANLCVLLPLSSFSSFEMA